MKKEFLKQNKGITLIALVITIIVLLILAGVAISMLSGENGILKQAASAKTKTDKESIEEQVKLGAVAAITNVEHSIESKGELETALSQQGLNNATVIESAPVGYIVKQGNDEYRVTNSGEVNTLIKLEGNQGKVLNENKNTLVKDANGNVVVVPAGFAVVEDANGDDTADKVTDGLVITDKIENGISTGNEFVWIPVGKVCTTTDEVKTETNTKTIEIARYVFKSDGSIMEDRTQTEPNGKLYTATTITETSSFYTDSKAGVFKTSVIKNGGYYIGRYEAGIDGTTDNSSLSTKKAVDGTVKPQSKKGLGVWNSIKQTDASKVSQAMYTNSNFTSELINSYAWDTAIIFIQKMSGSNSYASQSSLNEGSPITTGASGDVQYNIYDMASNVCEWSTEALSYKGGRCVGRGDYYVGGGYYVCTRVMLEGNAWKGSGFRPVLYM